ncbi:hypothetical protein V5799_033485 [Amblyomma americanum]|uniref:Uncharacterized protein n=1 Tax=Amblyomma americanum TaxID=6943 RepID=A0AAQ4DN67_AMBAM
MQLLAKESAIEELRGIMVMVEWEASQPPASATLLGFGTERAMERQRTRLALEAEVGAVPNTPETESGTQPPTKRQKISHPRHKIEAYIHTRKCDFKSTSQNRKSHPNLKIGHHIHIRKSDKIGCESTSGNRTSQPHQKIGHHIHIRKPDTTTTSENHITSASLNRTSHPHHKIGHHIHVRKPDLTSTSGNRTSHPHQEIGHHIHLRK